MVELYECDDPDGLPPDDNYPPEIRIDGGGGIPFPHPTDEVDLVVGQIDLNNAEQMAGNELAESDGGIELMMHKLTPVYARVPEGLTTGTITLEVDLPEGVMLLDDTETVVIGNPSWDADEGSKQFYLLAQDDFSRSRLLLKASGNTGPATLDPSEDAAYIWAGGGCDCTSCIAPVEATARSMRFQIGLGAVGFGENGGYLLLKAAAPPATASESPFSVPGALQVFAHRGLAVGDLTVDGGAIIPGYSGYNAWGAMEVNIVDEHEYELIFRCDDPGNPGTWITYRTVTVKNPDGATDNVKLQISEEMSIPGNGLSTRVWHYEWDDTSDEWELKHGEDDAGVTYMSVERRAESVNGAQRTETVTIEETGGTVVSKVEEVYEAFDWGEELVERTVDPDGLALKSVWTYYDNAGTDGDNYGFVESYVSPTGMWERYEYHTDGYVERTVRQLDDEQLTMADSMTVAAGKNMAIEYSEHDLSLTGGEDVEVERTLVFVKDSQEMASYVIRRGTSSVSGCDEEWRVQSSTADPEGAGTLQAFIEGLLSNTTHTDFTPGNSTGHLITRTWRYADEQTGSGGEDDSEEYEVKQVHRPDGSMMFYERTIDDDERTTVTSSGIPNSGGTAVVYGTRSTRVVDSRGNTLLSLSERVTPDANGGAWFITALVTTAESDEFGRPTKTDYYYGEEAKDENTTPGTGTRSYRTETAYGCCGGSRVESTTDRLGIVTTHTYDILGRRTQTTRADNTSGEIDTLSVYDAAGRATDSGVDENGSGTLTRGGTDIVTSRVYNDAGRMVSTEGPEGRMSYQVQRRVKADGSAFVVGTDTGVFYWETRRYPHDNTAPVSVTWTDSHGDPVLQAVCSTTGTWSKASPPDGTETLTVHRQTVQVDQWVSLGGGDYQHERLTYLYHDLSTVGGDWMDDLGTVGTDHLVVSKTETDALGRAFRQTDALGNITEPIFESGTGRTVGTQVGIDTAALKVVGRQFFREFDPGDDDDDPTGDWRPYVTRSYSVRPGLAEAPAEDTTMSDYAYVETVESYALTSGALDTHTMWSRPSATGAPWSRRITDDQGRVTQQNVFRHGSTTYILSETQTSYNSDGQVEHVDRMVTTGTGAVLSSYLRTTYFYDDAGRQVKTESSGRGFTKVEFDAYGRTLRQVFASSEGTNTDVYGTDAFEDDIVLSEVVYTYNLAGEVLYTTSYQRAHDAPGTVTGLLSDAAANRSRVSYNAVWRDDNGRTTHQAAYGTNGYAAFTRPGTPPEPDTSDDWLVSKTEYDDAGVAYLLTANDGRQTRVYTDDAGNRTYVVEGYDTAKLTGGNPATPANRAMDVNRVTEYEYNYANTTSGGGQMIAMTAIDPNADGTLTDSQTTFYIHSGEVNTAKRGYVPVNGRPIAVLYPDAEEDGTDRSDAITDINNGDAGDFVYTEYYAAGDLYRTTDQREAQWTSVYTTAGQLDYRHYTGSWTVPAGSTQRIGYTYGDAGELLTATTYSDAAGTTETSQVTYTYDPFYNRLTDAQDHDPTANAGAGEPRTLTLAYDLAKSGDEYSNALRLDTMTYPNGRVVELVYDGHNGIDAAISRANGIDEVIDSVSTEVTRYEFLGTSTLAVKDYTVPEVRLDFTDETGEGSIANDGYDGSMDRFGRPTRFQWESYDGSGDGDGDLFHNAFAYDRAGSRRYEQRIDAPGYSLAYRHDDLSRIVGADRGPLVLDNGEVDLSSGNAEVDDFWTLRGRDWELDQLGNQLSIDTESSTDRFTTAVNAGNEITSRTSDATTATDEVRNNFGSASNPDDSEIFTELVNCNSGNLSISGGSLVVDTGSGSAPALLITGEAMGNLPIATSLQVPASTSSGLVGLIFGYQSELDYWVYAKNFTTGDGDWEIYHIHDDNDNGSIDYSDSAEKEYIGQYDASGTSGAPTWYGLSTRPLTDTLNVLIAGMPGFTDGYPQGKYGLYTEVADAEFTYARWFTPTRAVPLSAAWDNTGGNRVIDHGSGDGKIECTGTWHRAHMPVLVRGLRADRFEVTFTMMRANTGDSANTRFIFNYHGPGHFDYIRFHHNTTGTAPHAFEVRDNASQLALTENRDSSDVPAAATSSDAVWYRVVSDGTDVYVYAGTSEANLDSKQSANTWCMRTTASTDRFGFSDDAPGPGISAGRIGFAGGSYDTYIDDITVKTDPDDDASFTDSTTFEETELEDDFTLTSGKLVDSPAYDDAGNLTFDGALRYTYNALNQLVAVYNGGVSAADPGSRIAEYGYGPQGRRLWKKVYTGDGQDDEQHFYYHGGSVIETRNGSDGVTAQDIWDNFVGLFIDSNAQTAVNEKPGYDHDPVTPGVQDLVTARYYLLQDQQFSVRMLINSTGTILERYEYAPYGEQTVMDASYSTKSGWTDYAQYKGFTGQTLDPESGLWYFRSRYYSDRLGTFTSADPLGYVDGMNLRTGYFGMRGGVDPRGLQAAAANTAQSLVPYYDAMQDFADNFVFGDATHLSDLLDAMEASALATVASVSPLPHVPGSTTRASWDFELRDMQFNHIDDINRFNPGGTSAVSLFHETIHVRHTEQGHYQTTHRDDGITDEGTAYAAQYMYERLVGGANGLESLLQDDASTCGGGRGIRSKWRRFWRSVNNIIGEEWKTKINGTEYTRQITESNVWNVNAKHMGFRISCHRYLRALQAVYPRTAADGDCCLTCEADGPGNAGTRLRAPFR